MIVYNNETIKNAIIDALDKMERGIEISEVDRNELIDVILKYGDRDFGIKKGNRKCTKEELQNSVYIHIVNKNNKCYIGQTSRNPRDRWKRNGFEYEGQVFYNAIKYYGWDNISHIVLCHGLNKEQANEMEIALISILKSTNRDEFGYNVANGGNGVGQHSEETKKKMSESRKGENSSWYGKHHSEETKKKIGEANKGENNHMYGKHHSEETRKKLSEANKGKQHSEETIEKIREGNKGKQVSEETRKKISENRKGKYTGEKHPMYGKQHSEETKKKISEANTGENNYWYGKQHSEETIQKMSEVKKGENNPSAKKVFCNGVIFSTVTQCSKFYKVNRRTMNYWLQGKYKTPSEFMEKGLKFATQEDIEKYPPYIEESENEIIEVEKRENNRRDKKVFCNGVIFSTVTQFAKFCNVSISTMSRWLQHQDKITNCKIPSEFIEQGLRFATEEDINTYPLYTEKQN